LQGFFLPPTYHDYIILYIFAREKKQNKLTYHA